MALPAGIVSKKLVISPGTNSGNRLGSLEVTIEPSIDVVVWQETGESLVNFFHTVRTTPGTAAIITLPVIDQPGYIDNSGEPVDEWHYKITVRYLFDGRKSGRTLQKFIKPRLNDPAVYDFDLLPSGDEPLRHGPIGPEGPPGKSAYELAVLHGYEGTEAQWLSEFATPNVSSGGSTFLGEGPPPTFIYGSKLRDIYIDTNTGAVYRLEDG